MRPVASTRLIGLLVGLVPALHASRNDLHGSLQQSSRRTASGHQLTRRLLVVAAHPRRPHVLGNIAVRGSAPTEAITPGTSRRAAYSARKASLRARL